MIDRMDFPDHDGSFDKFSHTIQVLELLSHVHLDIKSTQSCSIFPFEWKYTHQFQQSLTDLLELMCYCVIVRGL